LNTILHIKNMVCNRCIQVVQEELQNLGLTVQSIKFGEVEVQEAEDTLKHDQIAQVLQENGFELLDNRKAQLKEKIKNIIIELIHQQENAKLNINFSQLIEERLGYDYPYLSNLFSASEGLTIAKYIILQRIERVKELLVYNELSLSQIADKNGYSSVAHLSAQFKNVTGLTPSEFKKLKEHGRKPLDKV
jgi:AraC family transcriptional regulator